MMENEEGERLLTKAAFCVWASGQGGEQRPVIYPSTSTIILRLKR